MTELTCGRLARASRDWFSDTELDPHADAYVRYLSERDYARPTVNVYLESVAHFAHWCARRRIGLRLINESVAERFHPISSLDTQTFAGSGFLKRSHP